ncbi:MAG: hypothetical protein IJC76_05155 [Lachnospiraceae bacterium]|nr:hypothetical protein [Lachnospiraceae bacterium]
MYNNMRSRQRNDWLCFKLSIFIKGDIIMGNESTISTMILLMVYILVLVFVFVLSIAMWIAMQYPFYRMAKRQGIENAWLVFVPWGNYYITLKLSPREFNLFNLIKFENRSKAFILFIIATAIYIVLILPMSLLSMIPILGWLIFLLYIMAYLLISYSIMWRMYYDVLITYGMEEHAMWVSILGIFVPIVITVFAYMIMNKEPDMYA